MARRIPALALFALFATACADDVSVGGDGGTDSTGASSSSTSDAEADASSGAVVICTPGEQVCGSAEVLTCSPDGSAWESQACEAGQVCLDGGCRSVGLVVTTEVLPPATIGFDYAEQLEAMGGTPPYAWSVDSGDVPPGLTLDADGALSGMPTTPGDYVFGAAVTDDANGEATREFSLTVHPEPLTIITPPALGGFDEGVSMNKPLAAVGGEPPYGWLLVDGALPEGLIVDAAGAVTGTPLQAGTFDFRVRIVDAQEPPGYDEQDFSLDIDLRPLQIVGDQEYDLLAFKVIVLPLMTIIPGVPVPYSTQLTADGGQSPYSWSEEPLPGGLQTVISQAGIPEGLTLETDGTLSGSVTNTDQIITVPLLLSGIDLTGFFFYAQVADSQDTPETRSALFLIPTLPVGG